MALILAIWSAGPSAMAQPMTWTTIPVSTQQDLLEIEDFPNQGIVATGANGAVVFKPNSSAEWSVLQSGTNSRLVSAEALTLSPTATSNLVVSHLCEAFVVNSDLSSLAPDSVPGWYPENIPQKVNRLVNINIVNNPETRLALACDSGTVLAYKSDWTPSPNFAFQLSTQKPVNDLFAYSNWLILAVGDSGKIWRTFSLTNPFTRISQNHTTQKLNRIFGLHGNKLWIAGDKGTLLYSGNDGATWTAQDIPFLANLNGGFAADSTLWVCGDGGLILYKSVSDATWTQMPSGTTQHLTDIKVVGNEVYACGRQGTLLHLNRITAAGLHSADRNLAVSASGGVLRITRAGTQTATLEIFGLDGKKLCNRSIEQSYSEISLPGVSSGFVLLREDGRLPVRRRFVALP